MRVLFGINKKLPPNINIKASMLSELKFLNKAPRLIICKTYLFKQVFSLLIG